MIGFAGIQVGEHECVWEESRALILSGMGGQRICNSTSWLREAREDGMVHVQVTGMGCLGRFNWEEAYSLLRLLDQNLDYIVNLHVFQYILTQKYR